MSNVTNPLESVEAELAKLQAPDDKEAQRRAKIAELKAQKNQLLSAAAEVEKQALIAELKVDFDRSLAAWKKFQDDFEAELVALFSNYCHIRQHAVIAKNLQGQIEDLGGKPMPYLALPSPDMSDYIRLFGALDWGVELDPESNRAKYHEIRRNCHNV